MNFEPVELIKELMDAHGVSVKIFKKPYDAADCFDGQLRRRIYGEFDYESMLKKLEDFCRSNTVYMILDSFELHYLVLRLHAGKDSSFLVVGPYLMREHDEIIQEVIYVNQLPMLFSVELKKYYSGVPYFSELAALESEVFILARYTHGRKNFPAD
jgi:hypothetical protein